MSVDVFSLTKRIDGLIEGKKQSMQLVEQATDHSKFMGLNPATARTWIKLLKRRKRARLLKI